MPTEEADAEPIGLDDFLRDAATILEQDKKLGGLARAVRMAIVERGAGEAGEAWTSDIAAVLIEAEKAISQAHENPQEVELGPLADALEVVANWGLDPSQRMGNFIRHVIITLENLSVSIDAGMVDAADVNAGIVDLLDDLGFGKDARASQTNTNTTEAATTDEQSTAT